MAGIESFEFCKISAWKFFCDRRKANKRGVAYKLKDIP